MDSETRTKRIAHYKDRYAEWLESAGGTPEEFVRTLLADVARPTEELAKDFNDLMAFTSLVVLLKSTFAGLTDEQFIERMATLLVDASAHSAANATAEDQGGARELMKRFCPPTH